MRSSFNKEIIFESSNDSEMYPCASQIVLYPSSFSTQNSSKGYVIISIFCKGEN